MQMDLIETFLDLCETRSFNRTAERLAVTQSTVSARVRTLEKDVGARLFQRSRSGTALTVEGLRFEPHARALRHSWSVALNATRDTSLGGVTMRVGLQHDVVTPQIRRLIDRLRDVFPQTAFLLESDYSAQMCADLISGALDIAVLYSPRVQPDLYVETLGEVRYVMVSTTARTLGEVDRDSYIFGNYAPVFAQAHSALLPDLTHVSLSIGQNAAMVSLLTALSGTAYVLEGSATALVAQGNCTRVSDAPVIAQPLFAALNLRNRHRASYRRLVTLLREHFGVASR